MYSLIDLKLGKKCFRREKNALYHLGESYQLTRALQVGYIWRRPFLTRSIFGTMPGIYDGIVAGMVYG